MSDPGLRPLPFAFGLLVAAGCAYGLTLLLQLAVPALGGHRTFTYVTIAALAVATAVVQAIAVPVARADDKAKLTQYALVATFARMGVGVVLVAGYRYLAAPPDITYAFAFMLAYATFAAYETYALVRLSYATAPPRPAPPDHA